MSLRPINVDPKGLQALGARVRVEPGFVTAEAPEGGLRGSSMYVGSAFVTWVLGTANVSMAATPARDTSIIQGAA